MALALRWLARRDRFEAAVVARLVTAGFDESTATGAVEKLRRQGLLSDARLVAERLARQDPRRPAGRERRYASLLAEGAPEDVVRAEIGRLDPSDEAAQLETAIRARYRRPDEAGKATRWALGRGFELETIQAVVSRVFPDLAQEDA